MEKLEEKLENTLQSQNTEAVTATPAAQIITSGGEAAEGFETIRLMRNQRIRAASGTLEIIARPGAWASVMSIHRDLGIADITSGRELLHGETAPINHLLIIPRADNRGLLIHSEVAYILVRGDYTISE
jgi:hypothetical protein